MLGGLDLGVIKPCSIPEQLLLQMWPLNQRKKLRFPVDRVRNICRIIELVTRRRGFLVNYCEAVESQNSYYSKDICSLLSPRPPTTTSKEEFVNGIRAHLSSKLKQKYWIHTSSIMSLSRVRCRGFKFDCPSTIRATNKVSFGTYFQNLVNLLAFCHFLPLPDSFNPLKFIWLSFLCLPSGHSWSSLSWCLTWSKWLGCDCECWKLANSAAAVPPGEQTPATSRCLHLKPKCWVFLFALDGHTFSSVVVI